MDDKTTAEISVMLNDSIIAFMNKKISEWEEYRDFYINNNDTETIGFFTGAIKEMKRRRNHLNFSNKLLRSSIADLYESTEMNGEN